MYSEYIQGEAIWFIFFLIKFCSARERNASSSEILRNNIWWLHTWKVDLSYVLVHRSWWRPIPHAAFEQCFELGRATSIGGEKGEHCTWTYIGRDEWKKEPILLRSVQRNHVFPLSLINSHYQFFYVVVNKVSSWIYLVSILHSQWGLSFQTKFQDWGLSADKIHTSRRYSPTSACLNVVIPVGSNLLASAVDLAVTPNP